MATEATGQSIDELFTERLSVPLGLSPSTGYPASANTRYSGTVRSNATDVGRLLQGLLSDELVTDRDAYLADRTANVQFGFRPTAIDDNGVDWHYGFGFWKECDVVPYAPSCDTEPTISSPGAFGFLPWIDYANGYWAVIAVEERNIAGTRPSSRSTLLEQRLQPLIEQALTTANPLRSAPSLGG
jgi:CubicO group peptidase (beta-lactamase class C family)